MPKLFYTYKNGNYQVSIFEDGSKIREYEDEMIPEFPENCDIKLTQYCDNPICRRFCHEKSSEIGKHGDLDRGVELLKTWQIGTECAFGGGNTLSHPDIVPFLEKVKSLGLISNLTVNSFHFNKQSDLIKQLISDKLFYGLGCSFMNKHSYIQDIRDIACLTSNLVFHLIIGIHSMDDIKYICDNFNNPKILLLGYKTFGNGVGYFKDNEEDITTNIYNWFTHIYTLFDKELTLSFDNLAIEQLNLRRFFNDVAWYKFYQGDDGFANMYMDLVNMEYAISSRSNVKHKIETNDTIISMFKKIKK